MSNLFDSGLIVGRFQTFHKGHESLFEIGLRLCDRLLVFVGSSQESGTERNPFNVATRMKVIREVYNAPNILLFALADLTNENDISSDWGKYVINNVDRHLYKMSEIMFYGDDRRRSCWFNSDDIKDTSEFIVPRSRINISATELREMMVFDRRKEWMKWVNPRLHKMYDELRSELMSVLYYQEMLQR